MELTLPLTHYTGSSPAGRRVRVGTDVPGERAVTGIGGTATQCPATVRSGSPAKLLSEGRQADDPRTDKRREQREEGGPMRGSGAKQSGASPSRWRASPHSPPAAAAAAAAEEHRGPRRVDTPLARSVRCRRRHRPQKAGTITWASRPRPLRTGSCRWSPSADNSVFNNFNFIWEMWRPLYWTLNGSDPDLDQAMSIANTPMLLQRRQDRYDLPQAATSGRTVSPSAPTTCSSPRPGQGRDQGVPGELGRLRARPLPGQTWRARRRRTPDAGGQPLQARSTRPGWTTTSSTSPIMPLPSTVGQGLGERRGSPD